MLEQSASARIFHLPTHFIFVAENFRRERKKKRESIRTECVRDGKRRSAVDENDCSYRYM
jgi:hypothetical protein